MSKAYREILQGINEHAVIVGPCMLKLGKDIRLLTVIVLFYTFDVVKLGRGKQFASRETWPTPITLRPTPKGD